MNSVRKSLAIALLGGGAVGGLLVGAGIVREYAFAGPAEGGGVARTAFHGDGSVHCLPRRRQGGGAVGCEHHGAQDDQRRAARSSL